MGYVTMIYIVSARVFPPSVAKPRLKGKGNGGIIHKI